LSRKISCVRIVKMEIVPLTKVSVKIKGKRASLIIDPDNTLRSKNEADAVVLLNRKNEFDTTKIEGFRAILQGPGEYEVGGIKISGTKAGKHLVYRLHIDTISVAITNISAIDSAKDLLTDYQVLIFYTDANVDPSAIATLEPNVVIVYGEQAKEMLGKNDAASISKFSATREKLPEKMEMILLSV